MLVARHRARPGDRRPDRACRRRRWRSTSTSRPRPTGRIYLWGFLVNERRAGRATSRSAGSPIWTHELSRRWPSRRSAGCAAWSTGAVGRWSTTTAATRWPRSERLADPDDDPTGLATGRTARSSQRGPSRFVDLLEIVKEHYFGAAGLGLKLIARHAGFPWRDEDPGGLNSQRWFAEAVHGETAERRDGGPAPGAGVQRGRRPATADVRTWLRCSPKRLAEPCPEVNSV